MRACLLGKYSTSVILILGYVASYTKREFKIYTLAVRHEEIRGELRELYVRLGIK